ncbi:photosystem II assembly protein [Waterburya agarophytonicola K14]|uniref:Photosystem II assembly protein n=1 Tax=Waterburya agarophytonicola KI4 TaxID=2874699 RepID=A0A964BRQ8_9CYAN|nr:hypothetical protein [Waterburya agarophytonicola]MCC0178245.1 photosystem II assembly protein [Waterburya agarophytonicola KI4]
MINWLSNYWYDYQLKKALKQGKKTKAKKILKQLETSGNQLSCLATLYQQQLKSNNSLNYYCQEIDRLTHHLQETSSSDRFLKPQPEFINYIHHGFKLNELEPNLIQPTGINLPVFEELEIALVEFLQIELNKVPDEIRDRELTQAWEDLNSLKQGKDPAYNYSLTPHVYFIKYFLENVYCVYLAWFFIYQEGLLKRNINILDLAAGVNTSIVSLALLSANLKKFSPTICDRVNYYSLEQQADLQYRGLQFWRRYIDSFSQPLNTYFRFNTANLFDYNNYYTQIPRQFFDFIIISHCFFYESEQRHLSHQIYQQIFQQNLSPDGRVLLIIQGKKLFNTFDIPLTEDSVIEREVVEMFVTALGLKLNWYKYLSCTGKRKINKQEFARFARNNLPPQNHLSNFSQSYFLQHYLSHYAIDDYVILAQPLKANQT